MYSVKVEVAFSYRRDLKVSKNVNDIPSSKRQKIDDWFRGAPGVVIQVLRVWLFF